ncbi:MAG TPA: DUF1800 domain-containing protein [Vicinamibacterales bacterium]|nr:DUF1800 domain-containing protein [Vicinamibacterales bacterium]
MAPSREEELQHLLRRAGFGASEAEIDQYARRGLLGFSSAAAHLLTYQELPDDVDDAIGSVGYVGVTAAQGRLAPAVNINDARQRWLFRMVHSKRPLQEKMTLFWHNHFATAYSKIAGDVGATEAARMMAAKPSEDAGSVKGHLELLREHALGNFRDLLVAIAQDPAMLYWLDGRTNVRARPQENFARELMELFTMGVDTFTENDVYAGARVFTGWNLLRSGSGAAAKWVFNYNAAQHETAAKEFSFPIYPNGDRVIPARSGAAGLQDGLDLIEAVARHPATGPRLARKLYNYFINETDPPDQALIDEIAGIYYARDYEIEPMVRRLLLSSQFRDPANYYKRFSWPAEFVVRAIKEAGWSGFSVGTALTPMVNMGQQLLEPPDVNGWELGRGWFTTGAMLARMNFASQLATNQKFNLRDSFRGRAASPDALLETAMARLTPAPYTATSRSALIDYINAGGTYTASDTQVANKGAGVVHLIIGSGEYQLI